MMAGTNKRDTHQGMYICGLLQTNRLGPGGVDDRDSALVPGFLFAGVGHPPGYHII
jgi:hypothetical protein